MRDMETIKRARDFLEGIADREIKTNDHPRTEVYFDTVLDVLDSVVDERMFELPCKIGDTIYHVQCGNCGWDDCYMDECVFPLFGHYIEHGAGCEACCPIIHPHKFTASFYASNDDSFNKRWFLTRKDAEKTLAEVKAKLKSRRTTGKPKEVILPKTESSILDKDIAIQLEEPRYVQAKFGEWLHSDMDCVIRCSCCGERLELCYPDGTELTWAKYCPNCGAKMKEN